jgi:hypothetical protein
MGMHTMASNADKDGRVFTTGSPSATNQQHPSLQTKVCLSRFQILKHPHDDPGTHTTSHQCNQAHHRCLFGLFGLVLPGCCRGQTPCGHTIYCREPSLINHRRL